MVKYIIVTGGSLSGLGKGTCSSSIGVALKSAGYNVTAIKIDPYLNVDAGTISPMEHGEVFVLCDGHEGDLDLGNYERALDIDLTADHNITTGKVYLKVIREERNGGYLGRTVQIVPHVTDCVQHWLSRVARLPVERMGDGAGAEPDVCLVEVGGTVGDIESQLYLEALHKMFAQLGPQNFVLCHLVFVPTVGSEQKTKCAQHSFRELRETGLSCDFVFARTEKPLTPGAKSKLAAFAGVSQANIIGLPDTDCMYFIPQQLVDQNLTELLIRHLDLPEKPVQPGLTTLNLWNVIGRRVLAFRKAKESNLPEIKIGIVAKYMGSNDTYLSVVKALEHSACESSTPLQLVWINAEDLEEPAGDAADADEAKALYDRAWTELKSCQGILTPGGFGTRGVDGKVAAARYARENGIPYLGICLGMQTALIEGARTLLGKKNANSEEFNESADDLVIVFMPETDKVVMGGTMRLGDRETHIIDRESLAYKLYDGEEVVTERHRHRYEFNTQYLDALEAKGYNFVGRDKGGERLEIVEHRNHPFFFAVQYHPEMTSRPRRPNPCFLGFVLASAGKLQARLEANNGRLCSGTGFTAE